MIEGLKEVKKALEHAVRIMEEEIYVTRDQEKALAKLDAVIKRLDSEELVDRARMSIQNSDVQTATTGYQTIMHPSIAQAAAIAAINTIKGNKND